mmetsp:Transcript_99056/g.275791  ORF Transcript_99056/g.275791 Transcript_99056/m.275791 type:complete len:170 (-) Transcript_99056:159-668(-)
MADDVPTPDLERFIDAQNGEGPGETYDVALEEMRRGTKCSCWIWYIFPQFLDPERALSRNNQKYQLHSRAEAVAFLKDPTLGPRFTAIAQAVAEALARDRASSVMGGSIDAKKLHQSATVFRLAAQEAKLQELETLFHTILEQIQLQPYRGGVPLEDPEMLATWMRLEG